MIKSILNKVPMPFTRTNGIRDFLGFVTTVGGAFALFF